MQVIASPELLWGNGDMRQENPLRASKPGLCSEKSRDPFSDKVEGEDQHPWLSYGVYTESLPHTLTGKNMCAHTVLI